jgi:hypothetical protein
MVELEQMAKGIGFGVWAAIEHFQTQLWHWRQNPPDSARELHRMC